MREIWKQVLGFENIYSVSNTGKVKRNTTISKKGTGNYFRNEHLLKQRKNNSGYLMVDLYKENKRYQFLVHRLVAKAFIPNPYDYPVVNHKDENPCNNNVENLEWCTQKYNMNYGTCKKKIGSANSKRIVAIDKNGNRQEYESSLDAYRKTGISSGNIYDCLYKKRNRKTAGGYIWEFVK